MMMKRKFTKAEKLQIIKEASEQGVKATLSKHGIYPASFYSWKTKLEQMGEVDIPAHADPLIKPKTISFSSCHSGGYRPPFLINFDDV